MTTAGTHAVTADALAAAREREHAVGVACLIGLGGVAAALVAASNANSVTLWTEVLRTLGEFLANVLAWITLRTVARGNTELFNYGFGKLENLSSLAVAVVMVTAWAAILFAAWSRFRNPVPLHGVELGLAFELMASVINGVLWRRGRRLARRAPSPLMEAQWRLFRVKAIGNLCVSVCLALTVAFPTRGWTLYVDPMGSVLLSSLLLLTAYGLISSSMYDLMDRAVEERLQLVIVGELADFFDTYTAFHGVRSRHSGATTYVEIFLEFEGALPMHAVQKTIDALKASVEGKIPQSIVSVVPATAPPRSV
jgi:cation diffusion facilitator family transporter